MSTTSSSDGGVTDTGPIPSSSDGGVTDTGPIPSSSDGGVTDTGPISSSSDGGVTDTGPISSSSDGGVTDTGPISSSSDGGVTDTGPISSSSDGGVTDTGPISSSSDGGVTDTGPISSSSNGGVTDTEPISSSSNGGVTDTGPISSSSDGGVTDTGPISSSSDGGVTDTGPISSSSNGGVTDTEPISSSSNGGVTDTGPISSSSDGGVTDTGPISSSSDGGVTDTGPISSSSDGGVTDTGPISSSSDGGVTDTGPIPSSSDGGVTDTGPIPSSSDGGVTDTRPISSSSDGGVTDTGPISSSSDGGVTDTGPISSSSDGGVTDTRPISSSSDGGVTDTGPIPSSSDGGVTDTGPIPSSSDGGVTDTRPISSSSDGGVTDTRPISSSSDGGVTDTGPISSSSDGGVTDTRPISSSSDGGVTDTRPISSSSDGGVTDTRPISSSSDGGMTDTRPIPSSSDGGVTDTRPISSSSDGGVTDTRPISSSSDGGVTDTRPISSSSDGGMTESGSAATVDTTTPTTGNDTESPNVSPSARMPTSKGPLVACPDEFTEGETFCMEITPSDHSRTYSTALTYCQRTDRMDLMDEKEVQKNLKSLKVMMDQSLLPSRLIYVNEHGSASVRFNKTARVIDLNATTRFTIGVEKRLGTSVKNDGYFGICRLPKLGKTVSCDLSVFNETGVPSLSLPSFPTPLKEGSSFRAHCPQGPKGETRSFQFECSTRGHVEPHPSIYKCKYEKEPEPFWAYENAANPRYQPDCDYCHPRGTQSCTMVKNKGAQCNCKEGWRTFSCWLSPDFCSSRNCSGNGRCLNQIDHGFCECKGGFAGEDCQINRTTVSWSDPNKERILTGTSIATATLTGISLVIFIVKMCLKFVWVADTEDPQELFQDCRAMISSIGGVALERIACRFYFVVVHSCFTITTLFWTQEAVNVRSCCLARNRNEWDIDFQGKKRWRYDYLFRVPLTYLLGFGFVLWLTVAGWDLVPAEWTCLGVVSEKTEYIWLPLVLVNGLIAFTSASIAQYAANAHERRPHHKVMTHHFFEVFDPFARERVDKVFRNIPFVIIGPVLHFMSWLTLLLSTDKYNAVTDTLATIFGLAYSANNILQTIVTTPWIFNYLDYFRMIYLPAAYAPDREKVALLTRDEVINRKDANWIAKQNRKLQQEAKEKDERETREWNAKLTMNFPNAPAWLFRHPKEKGPEPILPPPPAVEPANKEYISIKRQERILRRWNQDYLEERLNTRMPPDVCAYLLSIWARFHLYVPSADNLDMGRRVDRDKVRTALSSFDFDPSSMEEIRTLQQMGLDQYDALEVQTYFKMPEPKMDYQLSKFDEAYFEFVDEVNAPYDLIYDDDEFVQMAMIGLTEEQKEGVRRTMNILPGIIEDGAKSRNPRKEAPNIMWFDETNVGFIGPSRSATAPLEPVHAELVTKQRHYTRMQEDQWSFMRRAANQITLGRQMRETYRGQL